MVLVNDSEVDEVLFAEMLESGYAVVPVEDQLGDVLLEAQAGEEEGDRGGKGVVTSGRSLSGRRGQHLDIYELELTHPRLTLTLPQAIGILLDNVYYVSGLNIIHMGQIL